MAIPIQTHRRMRTIRMRTICALLLGGIFVLSSTLAVFAKGPTFVDKLRYGPGATNHPMHVRPTSNIRIPDGWPLDTDGTLTCTTCHKQVPSLQGGGDPQLRGYEDRFDDISAFCSQCHNTNGQRSASSMHWMAMRQAHIPESSRIRGRSSGGQLDTDSRQCMECHDGVTATEFANSTRWTRGGGRGGGSLGDRGRNHPVGMPYTKRPSQRSNASMRLEALLPAAIRLPNGVVGCVSCHNLYATGRYRLTAPIENSTLCLTCHDMD